MEDPVALVKIHELVGTFEYFDRLLCVDCLGGKTS